MGHRKVGVYDLTFLFEKDSTFRNNYWDIPIYVTFSLFVCKRDGDICIFDTDFQRNAEYTDRSVYCIDKTC